MPQILQPDRTQTDRSFLLLLGLASSNSVLSLLKSWLLSQRPFPITPIRCQIVQILQARFDWLFNSAEEDVLHTLQENY